MGGRIAELSGKGAARRLRNLKRYEAFERLTKTSSSRLSKHSFKVTPEDPQDANITIRCTSEGCEQEWNPRKPLVTVPTSNCPWVRKKKEAEQAQQPTTRKGKGKGDKRKEKKVRRKVSSVAITERAL